MREDCRSLIAELDQILNNVGKVSQPPKLSTPIDSHAIRGSNYLLKTAEPADKNPSFVKRIGYMENVGKATGDALRGSHHSV